MFGKADQNPLTVIAFKKPEQFQAGIIDLPINAPISREDLIVVGVDVGTTRRSVLSTFVQHFTKQDRDNVQKPTNPGKWH